jgi:hypothetical protein
MPIKRWQAKRGYWRAVCVMWEILKDMLQFKIFLNLKPKDGKILVPSINRLAFLG